MNNRSPWRWRTALVLVAYAAAALAVTAPLPGHVTETVSRAVRADTWLNVWALAWTSDHLLDGQALFDANIFYPRRRTLAYSDHFIGQALIAGWIYRLSGNAVLAYNAAWYLALVLTAWGGYLWVRHLLGDGTAAEAAAVVAGAVCLMVPGKGTALGHLQVLSLQGLPFALLALHRLFDRPGAGRALALTVAATYTALCSWYTAAYTAMLLPGLAALAFWHRKGAQGDPARRSDADDPAREARRAAAWTAAALLIAVALMTPVALPYASVQRELGIARPVDEVVATSLRPIDWVSSWSWLHEGWMPEGSGAGGHFPGLVAFALLVVGVATPGPARWWGRAYVALAAVFALLSLGPWLRLGENGWLPLPYLGLYELVPGFTALRNPYRAAFVTSILLAAPIGAGAQTMVLRARGALLAPDRWRTRGARGARVGLATVAVAGFLVAGHLLEAWPGPQEIAPLPAAPTPAHGWLAGRTRAGVLELPLPGPPDLNARYQLWTIGSWVPLVNGHSGLFPPRFLRLYDLPSEFPDADFLEAARRDFPIDFVLVHYGRIPGSAARRQRAAGVDDLEEEWSAGEDVVYRLRNGAPAGWLRRRLPRDLLGARLEVQLPASREPSGGCGVALSLRAAVDDGVAPPAVQPEVELIRPPEGPQRPLVASVTLPPGLAELVELDLWLVDSEALASPPVIVRSRVTDAERRVAAVELNGATVAVSPLAIAVIDGDSGRLVETRAETLTSPSAPVVLRDVLEGATPGSWLAVAAATAGAEPVIEELRLLLDAAGGRRPTEATPLGTTGGGFAFVGRVGWPPGTAGESTGATASVSVPETGHACLYGPVVEFRFEEGER